MLHTACRTLYVAWQWTWKRFDLQQSSSITSSSQQFIPILLGALDVTRLATLSRDTWCFHQTSFNLKDNTIIKKFMSVFLEPLS